MNIKQAKNEIMNAMKAYFTRDETGSYVLPPRNQRPVFLMGPPGIGKTAIMEQIAEELGVALVSYSMTHHTRQSALGLPFIVHKEYQGEAFDVSEYTMSEIIASVYDCMEKTGKREGILFLDEINCVSETLSPVMLQFLQYKVFGLHRVPDGWIVVTAGNPPEYNNSVREFDLVTWDRLKRIDVQPDFEAWKEYAYKAGVHPAVLSYLDLKKEEFYVIESAAGGKEFATARGWEDLSTMIQLYEKNNIAVTMSLVEQYLQRPRTARDFASYYDLFRKYQSDYQVEDILKGSAGPEILERAKHARFDERLSLLGLILGKLNTEFRELAEEEDIIKNIFDSLKVIRSGMLKKGAVLTGLIQEEAEREKNRLSRDKQGGFVSRWEERIRRMSILALLQEGEKLRKLDPEKEKDPWKVLKKDYDARVKRSKKKAGEIDNQLTQAFAFLGDAFSDGDGECQETLILVTELTSSAYASRFLQAHGNAAYFDHNKGLLFFERQQALLTEIDQLDQLAELDLEKISEETQEEIQGEIQEEIQGETQGDSERAG